MISGNCFIHNIYNKYDVAKLSNLSWNEQQKQDFLLKISMKWWKCHPRRNIRKIQALRFLKRKQIPRGTTEIYYVCTRNWSRGRAVRQRSAKPCTAVRICSRPPRQTIPVKQGLTGILLFRPFKLAWMGKKAKDRAPTVRRDGLPWVSPHPRSPRTQRVVSRGSATYSSYLEFILQSYFRLKLPLRTKFFTHKQNRSATIRITRFICVPPGFSVFHPVFPTPTPLFHGFFTLPPLNGDNFHENSPIFHRCWGQNLSG